MQTIHEQRPPAPIASGASSIPSDNGLLSVGIVLIGRNEGLRLVRALESLSGICSPIVYVDSGSTDLSVQNAQSRGVRVVHLDMSRPFSAGRARHEGFQLLTSLNPSLKFIQFIDGDCELDRAWIPIALKQMSDDAAIGAICGRRREIHPEVSIYNRLCDLEWNAPIGEVLSCGGDAMVRVAAYREVGGFDPSIVAGEEPELCQRLRGRNWKIVRLGVEMTRHDASMKRFRQWWRRARRGGYGSLDLATRFGNPRYRRQVMSTLFWTLGWCLLLIVCTCICADAPLRFWQAMIIAVLPFVMIGIQIVRLAVQQHRRELPWGSAFPFGALTIISKWAQLGGYLFYCCDRMAGRIARQLEYK